MAYYSQAQKQLHAPLIKACLKKHGLKGSLSVDNHSSVALTISQGFDFAALRAPNRDGIVNPPADYFQVNTYHIDAHWEGAARDALNELNAILHQGHFDHSDSQSDYFHCAWYVNINIGSWNKPYKVIG